MGEKVVPVGFRVHGRATESGPAPVGDSEHDRVGGGMARRSQGLREGAGR